jgi:hypothetical protein
VDTVSVLNESVTSLLKRLNFSVCSDSIKTTRNNDLCCGMYLLCFVLFIIMKVVLQNLIWNFNESCVSNPDLVLHHVNFVTKLMYLLWHKPSNFTWTPHLNFVTKLMYMLWHKPSNFTWTSNFTAVLALFFSPTCQKAKFKRKMISIHTNSFIIITCPIPVLLVPGFGQVGYRQDRHWHFRWLKWEYTKCTNTLQLQKYRLHTLNKT